MSRAAVIPKKTTVDSYYQLANEFLNLYSCVEFYNFYDVADIIYQDFNRDRKKSELHALVNEWKKLAVQQLHIWYQKNNFPIDIDALRKKIGDSSEPLYQFIFAATLYLNHLFTVKEKDKQRFKEEGERSLKKMKYSPAFIFRVDFFPGTTKTSLDELETIATELPFAYTTAIRFLGEANQAENFKIIELTEKAYQAGIATIYWDYAWLHFSDINDPNFNQLEPYYLKCIYDAQNAGLQTLLPAYELLQTLKKSNLSTEILEALNGAIATVEAHIATLRSSLIQEDHKEHPTEVTFEQIKPVIDRMFENRKINSGLVLEWVKKNSQIAIAIFNYLYSKIGISDLFILDQIKILLEICVKHIECDIGEKNILANKIAEIQQQKAILQQQKKTQKEQQQKQAVVKAIIETLISKTVDQCESEQPKKSAAENKKSSTSTAATENLSASITSTKNDGEDCKSKDPVMLSVIGEIIESLIKKSVATVDLAKPKTVPSDKNNQGMFADAKQVVSVPKHQLQDHQTVVTPLTQIFPALWMVRADRCWLNMHSYFKKDYSAWLKNIEHEKLSIENLQLALLIISAHRYAREGKPRMVNEKSIAGYLLSQIFRATDLPEIELQLLEGEKRKIAFTEIATDAVYDELNHFVQKYPKKTDTMLTPPITTSALRSPVVAEQKFQQAPQKSSQPNPALLNASNFFAPNPSGQQLPEAPTPLSCGYLDPNNQVLSPQFLHPVSIPAPGLRVTPMIDPNTQPFPGLPVTTRYHHRHVISYHYNRNNRFFSHPRTTNNFHQGLVPSQPFGFF